MVKYGRASRSHHVCGVRKVKPRALPRLWCHSVKKPPHITSVVFSVVHIHVCGVDKKIAKDGERCHHEMSQLQMRKSFYRPEVKTIVMLLSPLFVFRCSAPSFSLLFTFNYLEGGICGQPHLVGHITSVVYITSVVLVREPKVLPFEVYSVRPSSRPL